MFQTSVRSLKILAVFSILTGIVYPYVMTGIGQGLFPFQANGSIVKREGKAIGSALIGQQFSGKGYFHGRPSAADYNAASSGASNWGPTSAKLLDAAKERIAVVRRDNPGASAKEVPADLVLASASGLDPHVSPESAILQADRVAQARKMPREKILELIKQAEEQRQFGFLGAPRVNVLKLNLALDMMEKKHER